MGPAYTQFLADQNGVPLRRRAATLSLVVALHLLLLFMLLHLAPPPSLPKKDSGPITVQLLPEAPAPTRSRATSKARRASGGSSRPRPARPPAPATATPAPSAIWSQVIPLTKDQFAAADIAKMPSRPAGLTANEGSHGSAAGQNNGSADEQGGGPHGERLFDADWYRKPNDAELAAYLPAGAPRVGWGMVACRTVAGFRVEDCHEIGQSPAGSGLARAVREAAWQFRVLPPRIGGRAMIGAWVRIRIDYSEHQTR